MLIGSGTRFCCCCPSVEVLPVSGIANVAIRHTSSFSLSTFIFFPLLFTRAPQGGCGEGDDDDDPAYDPAQDSHAEESEEEDDDDVPPASTQRHTVRSVTAPAASTSRSVPAARFTTTASASSGNASRPFARRASTGQVPGRDSGASASAGAGGASTGGGASSGGGSSSTRSGAIGGGERFLVIDQHGHDVKVAEVNTTMTADTVITILRETLKPAIFAQLSLVFIADVNPRLVSRALKGVANYLLRRRVCGVHILWFCYCL